MPLNFELLERLCQTPGIPGREELIRNVVAAEIAPLTDNISVDSLGNLIAVRSGSGGPRVMLAAHIDQIGFVVRHIDELGFLRLQPLGGWTARSMSVQRVWVHGFAGKTILGALMPQSKHIAVRTGGKPRREPEVGEYFVDLGLPISDVKMLVEIGDMVTIERSTVMIGEMVVSKALDDRLSVFVMIEALRAASASKAEVVAVATTQEEVGMRGAAQAAFAIEPDVAIAIDVTVAADIPEVQPHERVTTLGGGCALKVLDASSISNHKIVRHFRDLAEKHGIPHQLEVLSFGGTDAAPIQRSRAGVPSFTLSIPTRYIHSANEMAHCADIEAAITLLARYIEDAHNGNYAYTTNDT